MRVDVVMRIKDCDFMGGQLKLPYKVSSFAW